MAKRIHTNILLVAKGLMLTVLLVAAAESAAAFSVEPNWGIKQKIVADFNNDGKLDFGISLWKTGNYGSSKPFWVKKNDKSRKMHLFVYTMKNGELSPLWQSSNLPKINIKIAVEDFDNDGRNEILALECDYGKKQKCAGGYSVSLWRWSGWGFELEKSNNI